MSRPEAEPHGGQPVLSAGEGLSQARAAMILMHGRGAAAQDILRLAYAIDRPGVTYLAPEAAGRSWYPESFLDPLSSNEPWLRSAFGVIDSQLKRLREGGVPEERTLLAGFSQGACLVLEFAARNPRRYGGIAGLSGGLIGPEGSLARFETPSGSLEGTPLFLGCSDADPYIPADRVLRTAEIFRSIGAQVTARLYPGMGHLVSEEELEQIWQMMESAVAG